MPVPQAVSRAAGSTGTTTPLSTATLVGAAVAAVVVTTARVFVVSLQHSFLLRHQQQQLHAVTLTIPCQPSFPSPPERVCFEKRKRKKSPQKRRFVFFFGRVTRSLTTTRDVFSKEHLKCNVSKNTSHQTKNTSHSTLQTHHHHQSLPFLLSVFCFCGFFFQNIMNDFMFNNNQESNQDHIIIHTFQASVSGTSG